MINIHNISNLEMFDQEGYSVPCPNDLQEAIQAGIAKKVGKLLNTEGFLDLIPNFNPNEDTKLRIHLTKDVITIQLLERDTNNLKADKSYSEDNQLVTPEIKARKEKIIKKVDSLFKEPSAIDPSARLQSEKICPLFISQPNKEQVPSKIHFDATLSNPQIQQLHAKIENLQNQLNKRTPYPEELQVIKDQLELLKQAIHNLSAKQENITYPHTEEYALINKLVDNQRDIYRALLDLLSRNLNQSPTTPLTSPPAQGIENSILKEMLLKLQQEKIDLEQTKDSLEDINTVLQNALLSKDEQIIALTQQIQNLPTNETLHQLQSQLEILQNEKVGLQSKQDELTQASKGLEISNATLQENLLAKEEQIIALEQQIQSLPKPEALQKLQSQLEATQSKKADLQSQQDEFTSQLGKLTQASKDLESTNATLQEDLLSKEGQIAFLKQQIQNLPTNEIHYQLLAQLKMLQSDKADLQVKLSTKDEQIYKLNEEIQCLSEAYEVLQSQLEISSMLEKVTLPETSEEITSLDTIIKESEKTTKKDPSSLENSSIQESLLTSASGYYTLTAIPSLEESLETATEITTLQAKINDLLEELEDIRPIAYNTTRKIEIMEKSNKDLTLELSEKTKTIEGLEEEKAVLESLLDKSESRLKDLQRAQHTFNEQQKRISISSEENDDLLNELEKIQEQLSSEKRERAKLEETYKDRLEELKDLYEENALEKREHINAKIINLQQQQQNTCFTLAEVIAEHVHSESITKALGQNIVGLIEKAFDTTAYKTLLDLVSSEEKNLALPSEENANSDEYNEDSYMI